MFTKKQITSAIKITVLSAILIVGLNYVNAAWSGPTANPPSGGIPTPVNISSVNQVKNGGLGVNALSVFGDGLISRDMTATEFCFTDGTCISAWSQLKNPSTSQTPTVSLTANPTNVAYNGQTTLTWSSTNATSCSANWTSSTATNGTATKTNLTTSTTYTIACTGAGGSAQASATVTVGSAPQAPTVTLTASPSSVDYNGQSTLTWSSTNATNCSSNQFYVGGTSGSYNVAYNSPSENVLSYSITCTGSGGSATAYATLSCNKYTYYKDADGDLFPVNNTMSGCYPRPGYIRVTETSPQIGNYNIFYHVVMPGNWDCNDNDKNAQVTVNGYLDADMDGYAPNNASMVSCGVYYKYYTLKLNDCNDNNKDVRPNASYQGLKDSVVGWDYDCDGTITKAHNSVTVADSWLNNPPGYYNAYKPYGICEYKSPSYYYQIGYDPKRIDASIVSCGDLITDGSTYKPVIESWFTGTSDFGQEYCKTQQCMYVDDQCTKIGYGISWVRQICK